MVCMSRIDTRMALIESVVCEHAGENLSAYVEGAPVITVGNDMKKIEDNMKEAIEIISGR